MAELNILQRLRAWLGEPATNNPVPLTPGFAWGLDPEDDPDFWPQPDDGEEADCWVEHDARFPAAEMSLELVSPGGRVTEWSSFRWGVQTWDTLLEDFLDGLVSAGYMIDAPTRDAIRASTGFECEA